MSKIKGKASPYGISQNFLTSTKTINQLLTKTTIDREDTVLEIGAGKGHITNALASKAKNVLTYEIDGLLAEKLKPYFDVKICHHLHREDFHPAPRVDCVMMEFIKKPHPDIPTAQRNAFTAFVQKAKQQGIGKLLTKKQISTALRLAGLPMIERSGNILYIQWLCLFRCRMQFGKQR